MIKVSPAQMRVVREILSRRAPGVEVRAFGSRVDGTPKEHSDLDLAVVAPAKLGIAALEELREAFAQSDLPFRIDVLDWNAISDEFKKVIEGKYEVVQRAEEDNGGRGGA
ncbi:MAG: nucleotidyltransferase domain-containing protein [Elusimicrobia bacterium]|nr:nucleotidyltransferase domain-containing protein [Elusimicrobiota bacterium]